MMVMAVMVERQHIRKKKILRGEARVNLPGAWPPRIF